MLRRARESAGVVPGPELISGIAAREKRPPDRAAFSFAAMARGTAAQILVPL